MKSTLAIITTVCFLTAHTASAEMTLSAYCLNRKGKPVGCSVENTGQTLTITYRSKRDADMNRTINGKDITKIIGGEYSRRRVAESVAAGIVLTPLALFGLFSKKRLDTFGIQYKVSKDSSDSLTIMAKKKYGMALRALLESISGKGVEYVEPPGKQ